MHWVHTGYLLEVLRKELQVLKKKKKKKKKNKTLLVVFALIFGVLKNLPLRPMEVI